MTDLSRSMAASASGLTAQAARLRVTSENIANADTPGFRRKQISFEAVRDAEAGEVVRTGRLSLDQTELARIYDPANPLAGPDGFYDGSNVNLMIEIADAREAQRSYEANLKMFDQARQMNGALIDLLRR
jgi:flagellar basal-body rod protein FlgC